MSRVKRTKRETRIYVRDTQYRRAARRGRVVATRLGYTLYLGRDAKTGEYVVHDWPLNKQEEARLDPKFGEPNIVPRGHYWEKTLVAEGRAAWR